MTTDAKAEAVGLEEVLAAHREYRCFDERPIDRRWCACGWLAPDGNYTTASEAHRAHVAEQIRAHYDAALRSEAVVEAAARAINAADDEALTRTNFESLCATYEEQATAALTAAAETLRGGR